MKKLYGFRVDGKTAWISADTRIDAIRMLRVGMLVMAYNQKSRS